MDDGFSRAERSHLTETEIVSKSECQHCGEVTNKLRDGGLVPPYYGKAICFDCYRKQIKHLIKDSEKEVIEVLERFTQHSEDNFEQFLIEDYDSCEGVDYFG